MNTIYRGFSKEITFKVREANGDPIDLTSMSDIRGCLNGTVLDIAGGGAAVVGDAVLGVFKIIITAVQTAAFDEGNFTLSGQIEFGPGLNPIEFKEVVKIKDKPC